MLPRNAYSSDEEFTSALRDYFAGQALAGLAAQHDSTVDWLRKYAPSLSYGIADAMLAERAK